MTTRKKDRKQSNYCIHVSELRCTVGEKNQAQGKEGGGKEEGGEKEARGCLPGTMSPTC